MISKFTRTLLLASAVIVAVPATFASAQAYDGHRHHRETLQHRQRAACGHIHSHKARNSCEARIAHDWYRARHR
ncbi:hypothetical protein [Inquilinus limosus]|uniref:Uncharacterized protein n=1 Tax=Inquilinus limosus MP06 TaxID=1398085 RepID=A0A0A0DB85_9PROT|nr:hypothetical protein [Inquilinus limosus]KGM35961.1 hypothetical protein P409_01240 [Inquilinus limosus MP06]